MRKIKSLALLAVAALVVGCSSGSKDVEQALLDVIAKEGNLSPDEAEDYLNELREEKRYQRDVY